MDEEKQTSQTDTSESGVNPEEGVGDAESVGSSSDALKVLSEVSGREFKSVDDFKDHYGHLNKLVGDQTVAEQRKSAEKFTELKDRLKPFADKEGVDVDTYLDWSIAQAEKGEDFTKSETTGIKDFAREKQENETLANIKEELESLKSNNLKRDVLSAMPNAEKYYDDFAAWAKGTGQNIDAESFKNSPFNALVEADRMSEGSSVIESSSRVTNTDEYDQALREVRKNPTSEEAAQKLVEARLKQMEI